MLPETFEVGRERQRIEAQGVGLNTRKTHFPFVHSCSPLPYFQIGEGGEWREGGYIFLGTGSHPRSILSQRESQFIACEPQSWLLADHSLVPVDGVVIMKSIAPPQSSVQRPQCSKTNPRDSGCWSSLIIARPALLRTRSAFVINLQLIWNLLLASDKHSFLPQQSM